MKAPPVAEIRLTGNDEDVVIVDLNGCKCGTEFDFCGCDDESQDLLAVEPVPLVRKPKQSAVELLLLQQTQETTQ